MAAKSTELLHICPLADPAQPHVTWQQEFPALPNVVVPFHLFFRCPRDTRCCSHCNPVVLFSGPPSCDGGGKFSAQVFILPNHRPAGPASRRGTLALGPEAGPPESSAGLGRSGGARRAERPGPAGGALAVRRGGLCRGPAGGRGSWAEPGSPAVRAAGGGRVRGSAQCWRVPAEHCLKQVRAVKSHWYLWSVPTDVTNRSVLIAEVGALAVVEADGTLLVSNEHCWQSSEECLDQWDSGVAQCRGQVRGIFAHLCPLRIHSFFLAV